MRPTSSRSAPELSKVPTPGPHFTDLIEVRDFLAVHLPKLPQDQRDTIVGYCEGRTAGEIAHAAGITEEAVHNRYRRAIEKLRTIASRVAPRVEILEKS